MNILILGCGALGSRIAVELNGHRLYLVDMDRVGNENIPTSAFFLDQVGQTKVAALGELCYRRGVWTYAIHREFTYPYFSMPRGEPDPDLVVCTFDTVVARKEAVKRFRDWVYVLHAGVSADRIGCVGVDGDYPMPHEESSDNVVCTHLLGLPILSITAMVAAQYIRYLSETEGSVAGPMFVNSFGVVQHERVERRSHDIVS